MWRKGGGGCVARQLLRLGVAGGEGRHRSPPRVRRHDDRPVRPLLRECQRKKTARHKAVQRTTHSERDDERRVFFFGGAPPPLTAPPPPWPAEGRSARAAAPTQRCAAPEGCRRRLRQRLATRDRPAALAAPPAQPCGTKRRLSFEHQARRATFTPMGLRRPSAREQSSAQRRQYPLSPAPVDSAVATGRRVRHKHSLGVSPPPVALPAGRLPPRKHRCERGGPWVEVVGQAGPCRGVARSDEGTVTGEQKSAAVRRACQRGSMRGAVLA